MLSVQLLLLRLVIQDARNILSGLHYQIHRLISWMEVFLHLHNENPIHHHNRLHNVPDASEEALQSQLRQRLRLPPPSFRVLGCPADGSHHPQITQPTGFHLEFQYLVGGIRNPAPAFYDKQTKRYRKHNSTLYPLPGTLPHILHIPLVPMIITAGSSIGSIFL